MLSHFLLFNIGAPEILVILIIVVMVFGADKIPDVARGLGKGMRQIKDATNDIKKEINESAKENNLDNEVSKDIKKELNKVKDDIDDFTGPIKRQF
ncbi:Sec-independent protein translocase subunit TatA/TatB [Polaribacter porphyrae]|uniref:Sec-independent protein translocase protein TatA n=1 Tax=Polaribacter porphyrae TaxID=1137780 RepID=A0A2S7WQQ9_9FLAO|nr:twin-arginine translocase TatA/TatE family subunit [Polaribacter porphyrae]PQJ79947.1 Sec-independent protein translocase TatA [Polaribacter porphyrae]